jgi:hypothetical protein
MVVIRDWEGQGEVDREKLSKGYQDTERRN